MANLNIFSAVFILDIHHCCSTSQNMKAF